MLFDARVIPVFLLYLQYPFGFNSSIEINLREHKLKKLSNENAIMGMTK